MVFVQNIPNVRKICLKEAKAVVTDVVDSAKRAAQAFSDDIKKK